MKGIGIIMVIFVHAAIPFDLPTWAALIPRFCQMGCQVFIMLSSFCLCLSYDRNRQSLIVFFRKRLAKIVPGYWAMIGLGVFASSFSILCSGKNIFALDVEPTHVLTNLLLINGICPGPANNQVVRGGWFVGTIVLLYLLFPLLMAFFNMQRRWWLCMRKWIFPLLIWGNAFLILIVAEQIDSSYFCSNNSFSYYSFINQLPCFAMGFSLYDVVKIQGMNRIKHPAIKGTAILFVSFSLFYSRYAHAFILQPIVFSLSAFYFYIYLERAEMSFTKITDHLCQWGDMSYAVFLTHTIIVWDLAGVFVKLLPLNEQNSVVLFVICLPLLYFSVFELGKLFNRLLQIVDAKVKKS